MAEAVQRTIIAQTRSLLQKQDEILFRVCQKACWILRKRVWKKVRWSDEINIVTMKPGDGNIMLCGWSGLRAKYKELQAIKYKQS